MEMRLDTMVITFASANSCASLLADKRLMHLMGVTVVPEGESVGGEE
jgi:hypothetical protein